MKRIVLLAVVLLFVSSVSVASPLTDYSAGKASIDLTWRDTLNTASAPNHSYDFNKKHNLDGSVTFGLGSNFAAQYRHFEPKSADTATSFNSYRGGYEQPKTNEFNLLYKLDKNIAVLAGWVNGQGYQKDVLGSSSTQNKEFWQLGIVATIAPKTTVWGSIAAGSDLTNCEVGLSYEFCPSWEFNVSYRELDLKGIANVSGTTNWDLKAKGLGYGVTYKY